jgi:hypothetical protein
VRFAFIDRYRGLLPRVHPCRLLAVTDRGLRAWRGRPAPRLRTDMVLLAHIKERWFGLFEQVRSADFAENGR